MKLVTVTIDPATGDVWNPKTHYPWGTPRGQQEPEPHPETRCGPFICHGFAETMRRLMQFKEHGITVWRMDIDGPVRKLWIWPAGTELHPYSEMEKRFPKATAPPMIRKQGRQLNLIKT